LHHNEFWIGAKSPSIELGGGVGPNFDGRIAAVVHIPPE
jgi:hypothetical protein